MVVTKKLTKPAASPSAKKIPPLARVQSIKADPFGDIRPTKLAKKPSVTKKK